MSSIYDQYLDKNRANYTALSPVSFVERSAEVFGDLRRWSTARAATTGAQTRDRSARLAAALRALGVGRGSDGQRDAARTRRRWSRRTTPCRRSNAVLNTLNTRLDAPLLAWQMNHCEARC